MNIRKYLTEQTPYPVPVDSDPYIPAKAKTSNLKKILKKMDKKGKKDNPPFRSLSVNIHEIVEKYMGEGFFTSFSPDFRAGWDTMTNPKPGKKPKKKRRKYAYEPTPISGMEPGVGSTSSGTPGVRAG